MTPQQLPFIFQPPPFPPISSLITIIIVTSAVPIHPHTELIEAVLSSLIRQEPEMAQVHKIIVCDAPKIKQDEGFSNEEWKSGRISPNYAANYFEYISSLEIMCALDTPPFVNCEVIKQTRYGGFSMAVKEGLAHTTTPFVFILQHDRIFCRPFGAVALLQTMLLDSRIQYLGLASNSSKNHAAYIRDRYRIDVMPLSLQTVENNPRTLTPLMFWYDSNHFARTSYYRDVMFDWLHFPGTRYKPVRLRTGDFFEDRFGQGMLSHLKAMGMTWETHKRYGAYILDVAQQFDVPYVRHCHGRLLNTSTNRRLELYMEDEG